MMNSGTDMPPKIVKVKDFAARWAVSERTMRRRIAEGIVPAIHANRRMYIPLALGDKRYTAYLQSKEKEYRASRVQKPKTEPPTKPTLADRAFDIGKRMGDDFTLS